MKSLYRNLALLLLSLTVITACKNEDDTSEPPPPDNTAENKLALGESAGAILSSDFFQRLTVEIVYSEGFRPKDGTISSLITFLNERVNKPGGINIVETVIPAPAGAPFNINEIVEIEDNNRTEYNENGDLAVYIFFANGSSVNDTQTSVTLGTAYRNTSIVIYEKTLRDLVFATPGANLEILETATLQHEFGHIFGLVNILNDDIHVNHEDEFHPKHCVVEECLMYFNASFATRSAARAMMMRSTVPVFDTDLCIQDLQAKGGK